MLAWPPGSGWDDFDWRVSLAAVDREGPFSVLPGVRRGLAVAAGTLKLHLADETFALSSRSPPRWFDGGQSINGTPKDRVVVLNVMVRVGKARVAMLKAALPGDDRASTLLIVTREQTVWIDKVARRLEKHDALLCGVGVTWQLSHPEHAYQIVVKA